MALLRFEDVVKRYAGGAGGDVVAVKGISLSVDGGELVALVGKSGSGKSTLLHLAGGLDVADAGRVLLDDQDLGRLDLPARSRLRRRDIGFIFQFFHLIPTLTVLENVELPLLLDGAKRGPRGRELLERVGVGHRADHLPSELSGGEMQRAAVARALIARPKLVLADEPTGNLDSANAAAVLALLREEVRAEGTALLMVTHDDDAAALADRRHVIADGHLVETSTISIAPAPAPAPAPSPDPGPPSVPTLGPPPAPVTVPDPMPPPVAGPGGSAAEDQLVPVAMWGTTAPPASPDPSPPPPAPPGPPAPADEARSGEPVDDGPPG